MNLKFVTNAPVAVVGLNLILCELHFGIELAMQRRGINVKLEPEKYCASLNSLKKQTKTRNLIVIGDFKHTITGYDQRERNYFNEFIHGLQFEKITIVKGNHDSLIEEMCRPFPKIKIEPAQGMVLTEGKTSYGLFHGHAAPSEDVMQCATLLTGHHHPGIQIGQGEFSRVSPAWIVAPMKEKSGKQKPKPKRYKSHPQTLIVFPSFNPLSGSIPFNALSAKELRGIFSKVDLGEAEVILLNGQRIGKIKHLRIRNQGIK